MTSVKARAMVLMLRGLRKAIHPENMSVEQLRRGFELLMSRFPIPAGVQVQKRTELGMRGWSIQPEVLSSSGCILFLHGGAYAMGSGRTHASWVAQLALNSGCRVFMPDYPLAPEQAYPAAIQKLSEWLVAWSAEQNQSFVLAGDSAGGGLALALHHSLLAQNRFGGRALTLFSPWVDLRPLQPEALAMQAHDAYIHAADVERFAELYAAGQRDNPAVSPILWAHKTRAAVWLHYCSNELLAFQCSQLVQIWNSVGLQVEQQAWQGLFHVFQATGNWLPESENSLLSAGRFIQKALND